MAPMPTLQAPPPIEGVIYDDWRSEGWLPDGGGRHCRHLPTNCVFECSWRGMEPHAELREGSCEPKLHRIAEKYFLLFGCINPYHQPPGVPIDRG
jgi:hypothetical protein